MCVQAAPKIAVAVVAGIPNVKDLMDEADINAQIEQVHVGFV